MNEMNEQYFKITKINKLHEVNNDMVHNYYYIVYGRLYNNEHTMYRKFKFILHFDIFDIQEYYDIDSVSNEDIKEYASFYAYSECLNYELDDNNTYYNKDKLKEFYEFCNKTINNYNRII